jgi:two-component system cell cycle response regulator
MAATILVIEDNAANLELMTYLLHAFGYETRTAVDGRAGFEAALHERPDVILCDLALPGMDGYEVARQVKAHPNLRTVPIVAVTASVMADDRTRVVTAGFDGYITKPITPETFVHEVEAYLPTHEDDGHHPDR